MDQYEESNATIQARHPKLFKHDTYIFDASKELVMCMPFDFINGLKDKNGLIATRNGWSNWRSIWKKAQSSNIKQIGFIRHIGRLNIYENLREYESKDDCYICKIFPENDASQYVNFGQISDIIGEEEWLQGEVNCLCNIASSHKAYRKTWYLWKFKRVWEWRWLLHIWDLSREQIYDIIGEEEWLQWEVNCLCNIASSWIISFSWGEKKKESKNSDASCICVDDRVSMKNNGKHWIHLWHIIRIDKNTKNSCCEVGWDTEKGHQ